MKMQIPKKNEINLFLIINIIIISIISFASCANYLTERPDVLQVCKQSDANFKQCFFKNFQNIFTEWKDGIPGLPSLGSVDPLHVKRIVIADDGNSPVSVKLIMTNLELRGLSKTILNDISLNAPKYVVKLQSQIPKVHVKAEYNINGRILALPLIGSGRALVDVENLVTESSLKYKLREENGIIFADVEKLRVEIKDVGGFHLNLDNPNSDQMVLEEAANAALNENWREYFEILRPSIAGAIESIVSGHLKKIFAYIPAKYFIEDISLTP
ncbi:protein takeout-like [Haematobia irritans]|uniref:protein takeout-like n=1 Tax=Haematobia irritans TaxID=7368 RepID=UPI003F50A07A